MNFKVDEKGFAKMNDDDLENVNGGLKISLMPFSNFECTNNQQAKNILNNMKNLINSPLGSAQSKAALASLSTDMELSEFKNVANSLGLGIEATDDEWELLHTNLGAIL